MEIKTYERAAEIMKQIALLKKANDKFRDIKLDELDLCRITFAYKAQVEHTYNGGGSYQSIRSFSFPFSDPDMARSLIKEALSREKALIKEFKALK